MVTPATAADADRTEVNRDGRGDNIDNGVVVVDTDEEENEDVSNNPSRSDVEGDENDSEEEADDDEDEEDVDLGDNDPSDGSSTRLLLLIIRIESSTHVFGDILCCGDGSRGVGFNTTTSNSWSGQILLSQTCLVQLPYQHSWLARVKACVSKMRSPLATLTLFFR